MSEYIFEENPGDEERRGLRRIEAALDVPSRNFKIGFLRGVACLLVTYIEFLLDRSPQHSLSDGVIRKSLFVLRFGRFLVSG